MTEERLEDLLASLQAMAPSGHAAGLHIRAATPLIVHNTYAPAWVSHYNAHSYWLRDPTVFWGMSAEGTTRWSAITLPDPFGVMRQAVPHGLRYGAIASCGPITSRSIVSIARADREFTDQELARLSDLALRLHQAAQPKTGLTRAQAEALRLVAEGERHEAAARRIGITGSAFKARLQSARQRLGARTTSEAVRKAREYRLL